LSSDAEHKAQKSWTKACPEDTPTKHYDNQPDIKKKQKLIINEVYTL
jgi:hypothetical protein